MDYAIVYSEARTSFHLQEVIFVSAEPKTIIIVEDEPDTAEMFAEMMRLCGFQAMKTYGGQAAINLLSRHKPDAMVLDLMMPDISGLDVITFVRNDPELRDVPIVVVSAKSMPADIKFGLDMGASVYLTKPVAYMDLKEAVEQSIRMAVRQ